MIEGYSVRDWKTLPIDERATLFGENLWEYGERNIPDLIERERFDQINRLTVDIYTGRLSEEERAIALAEIEELRALMLENPDREVGRAADLYAWIAALHFYPEIKDGVPAYHPATESPKSITWYEVKKTYDPKNRRSYTLIPHN